MGVFQGLKPEAVWGYFEEICQVPRPSKKEEDYSLFVGLGKQTRIIGKKG